ncbi:hypothetical protein PanWU01x14_294300, partial [Parasponia andersonii]
LDEAFITSVYLINRLPTPLLGGISPFEALFGTIPGYSTLRIFGCACFPNVRPFNKHTLEFRSTQSIFLGNSLNHRGYKCLHPSGRVIISRDVIFNEVLFPSTPAPLSSTSRSDIQAFSGPTANPPVQLLVQFGSVPASSCVTVAHDAEPCVPSPVHSCVVPSAPVDTAPSSDSYAPAEPTPSSIPSVPAANSSVPTQSCLQSWYADSF